MVESTKRSEITQSPRSSAGRIVRARCSSRAAKWRSASVRGAQRPVSPVTSNSRMSSAPGAPPGSRVVTTLCPNAESRSASRLIWVDFPAPSPPSSVMNLSRATPSVAEHDVLQATHGPGKNTLPLHRAARIKLVLLNRHVRRLDLQHAHFLPGSNRRNNRRVIGDRHLHVLALLWRHDNADIRLGHERHLLIGTLPDRRIVDRRTRREKVIALEGTEAPIEKLRAFICPRLLALQPVHHQDETLPAALGGGDKPIARGLCMAGLEAVYRRVEIERRIAITLPDAVPCEIKFTEHRIIFRE